MKNIYTKSVKPLISLSRRRMLLCSALSIIISTTLLSATAKADEASMQAHNSSPKPIASDKNAKIARQHSVAPNTSPVVTWVGRNPVTSGGFGANPVPGVVGAPGSLALGFRVWEDYSYLKTPPQKKDFMNPVKYIPLNSSGDVYLTLSGDERFKYQTYNNGNFGVSGKPLLYDVASGKVNGTPCTRCNNANIYGIRNDFGADLHVTKYFRAYAELVNAEQFGNLPSANQSASGRNDLVLVQGLVEFNSYLMGGKEGLQLGRWLPHFGWLGSGGSTLNNVFAPSYNGGSAYYDNGRMRTSIFYGIPGINKIGVLRGGANSHLAVWGNYNTIVLPQSRILNEDLKANLDLFYFGTRVGGRSWQNTATAVYGPLIKGKRSVSFLAGQDERQTIGARYYGSWGNWRFDGSLAGQLGSFDGMDVRAFDIMSQAGYTFRDTKWQPTYYVRFDVASGGVHKNSGASSSGHLNDFLPIDESTNQVVPNSFVMHSNLIDIAPHIVLNPAHNVRVDSFVEPLWRYAQGDALQNSAIAGASPAYAATAFVPGHYIGTLLDVRPEWDITPHLSFNAEIGYIIAGTVLREAGAGNYFYMYDQLEFKW